MAFPKSRILSASKFIQVFKESAENKQRFCFILGSGASVDSGIPTGNQLEMQWMNELMFSDPTMAEKYADTPDDKLDEGTRKLRTETETLADKLYDDDEMTHRFDDIKKAWKEALKSNGNLSSKYYFDLYKLRFHPNPQNGYRFLEELMQDKEPSLGYRVLSLLLTKTKNDDRLDDSNQHNLVITTNFDSLTEDALFLYTDKKPLVISHESLAAYIDSDTQRPIIAKVHRGLMFNPFNSPETTDHLEREWHEALDYAFKTYTPVVIGYGGGDGSLMTYLQQSTSNKGIYWCYLDKYGLPGPAIQKFVRRRNGCLVSIDGFDKFMLELGLCLYPTEIMPPTTSEYLKKQMDTRVKNYTDQYNILRKKKETRVILPLIDLAEEKLEEILEKKPELTFWEHLFRANRKSDEGDYHGAIVDYTSAISKNPSVSTAFNNRGHAYYQLKKYSHAIKDFNKAIEISPNSTITYCNRGDCYDNIGQYSKAIQDYSKAIELNPKNDVAFNNRGYSYNNMKEYDLAIQDLNTAIQLTPNAPEPYHHRGYSYMKLGEPNLAVCDFTKAIELDPKYTKAYRNRSKAYRALEKFDLAEADEAKVAELEAAEKKDNP